MGGSQMMKERIRARQMETDPHCWYCGTRLVWIEGLSGSMPNAPSNMAVVESAVNRNHVPRVPGKRPQPQGARQYLACYACAEDRARWSCRIAAAGRKEMWAWWREYAGLATPRRSPA